MPHDGHSDHDHHHTHHHAPAREPSNIVVSAFVITCSDTRDLTTDESGALAVKYVEGAGHSILGRRLVRDDAKAIRGAVEEALEQGARAVIITGGTGIGRRDVTIETITPMFEKTLDGFGELFRSISYEDIGTAAMATRACAGLVRGSLLFALPGSPRAVKLGLERLVLPELGHLVREVTR